jgi:hypothetical protein
MWRFQAALRRDGYRVLNLTYRSRAVRLEELGREWLPAQLRKSGFDSCAPLHVVTHSLGGILVRMWLRETGVPANLGRVVMIAPPNAGSEIVDHVRQMAPLRWLMSVNGIRLGTDPASLPRSLGPWPAGAGSLGILAGDVSFNPLFSHWLGDANDSKVRVVSARLDGMADFRVLHQSHTLMLWRAETVREVRAFLQTGRFSAS